MVDLMHVFNDLPHQLGDADAIRVSLLYMLEQGFLGKHPRQPVTNERLAIISNLGEFNIQLRTFFDKIGEHLNPTEARVDSRHTYTLQGFVYKFKILIMKTFPNSIIVGSPISSVIPQVVAYLPMRRLYIVDCKCILDVRNVCSLVHIIIYKLL
uniref:Uncharacterized protein n=1 Tax=Lactuca sativa TaxID=4236 RepID=A0A9R1UXD3_LACSA|nr:hypothetical protein LSAT_V11C700373650 [Lactuca sativa]